MPTWHPDANEVFLEALELLSPAERHAYLEKVCAGKAELRARVDGLLSASSEAGSFLEASPVALAETFEQPVLEGPGTQIGPYKLLEQIGEGGFGVVYMAEQHKPLRRKVALKILKPGMDTRQVIARFEAERQALALMDHPNIARVLDAGAVGADSEQAHGLQPVGLGRPYFVMELVRGRKITEFCDQQKLDLDSRLELFITVCQAVQHAHQKGIIHRDIKPSNVLVTLHDGKPVAKVIDFGIAKAMGQQLTERTLFTCFDQMIGTPLYMSPEQAELSGLDIDTRTDVYSLGVLLYELLTGATPFDAERFKQAGHDEMRRIIREEEPPKPSTRVSTVNEASGTIASNRQTDPRRLSLLFRGELDWIVLKCLEKDRTRRYDSPGAVASDLQRYLEDEPVQACPPSTLYQVRKIAHRHRAGLLTATVVIAALLIGSVISAWQAFRATTALASAEAAQRDMQHALRESQQSRTQAESARKEAETAAQDSDEARKQAESVTDYLVTILRSPDPDRGGRTITVAELLDAAVEEAETKLAADPVTKIHLLRTIARTYDGLSLADNQLTVRESAFRLAKETGHPDTLIMMIELGAAYRSTPSKLRNSNNTNYLTGRLDEALAIDEQAVAGLRAKHGLDHQHTRAAMDGLARTYAALGRLDESIAVHEGNLIWAREKIGPNDHLTLRFIGGLADAYISAGRYDDAIALYESLLAARRQEVGPAHRVTLATATNLARAYERGGRLNDAILLHEETLKQKRSTLGPEHSATLRSMNHLGLAYRLVGRSQDSLDIFHEEHQLLDRFSATRSALQDRQRQAAWLGGAR